MYFPYLRGKQFELIALRDMSVFIKDINLISPIIEPVRTTTATLFRTLEDLKNNGFNFNIILNPHDGEIKRTNGYASFIDDLIKKIGGYSNYQPSFIINRNTDIDNIVDVINSYSLKNISLIISGIPESNKLLDLFSISGCVVRYAALYDDSSVRRLSRSIGGKCENLILFADRFLSKARNVDYLQAEDEEFTDDHLFYKSEGYCGFSDFATIGKGFSESGFLPYAIAIHLTYLSKEQKIRIHHFVSDSNDDTDNTAGKLGEALDKLVPFVDRENIHTQASEQFRKIKTDGSYPGLGVIKKISILNHIEVVYNYLSNELLHKSL
ncbi:sce7725 family protein [uncultured Bacteroides sp.]|uniref:sce7725 family protein n=1 Tax=uncultured Bacteroides sp. TaxID=162156 RepID=UPI002AAB2AC1|nr:sce7725 family protein [uncultured Bacteroides sp.]